MPNAALPIAIFHEHPDWFRPLFTELERREIPYVRLDAASHQFDPSEREVPYSLVVNRASPSAYLRAHGQTTFYTLHWLKHLERTRCAGRERVARLWNSRSPRPRSSICSRSWVCRTRAPS